MLEKVPSNEEMLSNIKEDIRRMCESPNNFFGVGIYQHIESVATMLSNLLKFIMQMLKYVKLQGGYMI